MDPMTQHHLVRGHPLFFKRSCSETTTRLTHPGTSKFCYLSHIQHHSWTGSSDSPGMRWTLSRPEMRGRAWHGRTVVCWLGLCWPPAILASSLLWAMPAQHVMPSSTLRADRMSAAICEPTARRRWQPHEQGLMGGSDSDEESERTMGINLWGINLGDLYIYLYISTVQTLTRSLKGERE